MLLSRPDDAGPALWIWPGFLIVGGSAYLLNLLGAPHLLNIITTAAGASRLRPGYCLLAGKKLLLHNVSDSR